MTRRMGGHGHARTVAGYYKINLLVGLVVPMARAVKGPGLPPPYMVECAYHCSV